MQGRLRLTAAFTAFCLIVSAMWWRCSRPVRGSDGTGAGPGRRSAGTTPGSPRVTQSSLKKSEADENTQ